MKHKLKFKLDNWDFKSNYKDTRKCSNKNIYDGNSLIKFLNNVKKMFKFPKRC